MSLGQDLADFLLARIAEEDFAAKQALDPRGTLDPPWAVWDLDDYPYGALGVTPLRVLAECAAKRKIVEELRLVSAHADTEYDSGRVCAFTASLMLLADVYADHPDYDETWRP